MLALFSCERTMGLALLCTKFALPLSGNNKNNLRTGFMAIIKATLKLALNDHGQMSLEKMATGPNESVCAVPVGTNKFSFFFPPL